MQLKIYTESYNKDLFRAAYFLEKKEDLKITLISSRFFSNLYSTIRGEKVYSPFKSLISPVSLLFSRNIVLAFAPYGYSIYLMYIFKIFKKNIVYHTSWPYWDRKRYVKNSNLFTKKLWESFLKNTKTICSTNKTKKEIEKFGALAFHVPHCVDCSMFKPGPKEKQIKILYVGRMNEEKGILSLLKIIEKINSKNVKFVFVGKGPLDQTIKEKSKTLPIEHLGFVKDRKNLAKIYSESDIFVLNSYATEHWEELFGIVLVEAMASGLPVISTDCIGPKEIVKNNKNGFLIPQKDDKALSDKLNLLIKDKKLREKFGKNSRELAIKNYSNNKISKDWLEILK
jgi:glycosyltransferase involved in cell wall biosynthesis